MRGRARRAEAWLFGAVMALGPSEAAAQRPADITGRVTEAGSLAIEGALVEVIEAGAKTITDAAGRFRFRALSGGQYGLRVSRLGYQDRTVVVQATAGVTAVVDVDLRPLPIGIAALDISVAREAGSGTRIDRDAIERSGARSAGDALRSVPGVVIQSRVLGGAETVSVRGAGADAVLVLLDGVVLNDPVTGEADLSRVSAESIGSIVVVPGAQSARYGPRAEAGVILIESRSDDAERALKASFGSLGSRGAAALWGASAPIPWSAGIDWTSMEGAFDFDLPDEVGGGSGRRANADAWTVDGWIGGSAPLRGGTLRLRSNGEMGRRGLPGRGYAPSPGARQEALRVQGAASWDRVAERSSIQLSMSGFRHATRFRDGHPPFGTPYDDTARVVGADLRAEVNRRRRPQPGGLEYGGGLEARAQRIEISSLDEAAPPRRIDTGVFLHARHEGGGAPRFSVAGQLRADRDSDRDRWALNRSLTLGFSSRALRTHAALRTSYSPPTLGDQYFRDALGVEPNPDLGAERVPLEIEAGLGAEGVLAATRTRFSLTGYRGDVRGMIVWMPDYRFVWSPQNVDVNRLGAEARLGAEGWDGRGRLSLGYAYARVTYDRPGSADAVQVVYRPRHTASITGAWQDGPWTLDLDARFIGTRYPVPAPVNALPPFWTLAAAISRDWQLGAWRLSPALRVDRLFDERGTLIFGFPDPGRVLRLDLALRPARTRTSATTKDVP